MCVVVVILKHGSMYISTKEWACI